MATRRKPSTADSLQIKELSHPTEYLSTGCTLLDLAIADRLPGGFGVGRISHIWGVSSSAKSVLVSEPLGACQRKGGLAALVDSEGTFDFIRAPLFGVSPGTLTYISGQDPEIEMLTIQLLFNHIEELIELKDKEEIQYLAIGIDSLSSIPSSVEIDGIDPYGASRAKELSRLFRKIIWKLNKSNTSLILIDQARENIGVTFGSKWTFSGGQASRFYSSTRVFTNIKGKILNKHKRQIGVEIGFNVEKNKIAPPGREGTIRLLFDYGIDDIGTNLMFLNENDDKSVKGYHQFSGKKLRFDVMVKYVEDNELEKALEAEVYAVWREIYKPIPRKEKVR